MTKNTTEPGNRTSDREFRRFSKKTLLRFGRSLIEMTATHPEREDLRIQFPRSGKNLRGSHLPESLLESENDTHAVFFEMVSCGDHVEIFESQKRTLRLEQHCW